jgi:hypothetical protein
MKNSQGGFLGCFYFNIFTGQRSGIWGERNLVYNNPLLL